MPNKVGKCDPWIAYGEKMLKRAIQFAKLKKETQVSEQDLLAAITETDRSCFDDHYGLVKGASITTKTAPGLSSVLEFTDANVKGGKKYAIALMRDACSKPTPAGEAQDLLMAKDEDDDEEEAEKEHAEAEEKEEEAEKAESEAAEESEESEETTTTTTTTTEESEEEKEEEEKEEKAEEQEKEEEEGKEATESTTEAEEKEEKEEEEEEEEEKEKEEEEEKEKEEKEETESKSEEEDDSEEESKSEEEEEEEAEEDEKEGEKVQSMEEAEGEFNAEDLARELRAVLAKAGKDDAYDPKTKYRFLYLDDGFPSITTCITASELPEWMGGETVLKLKGVYLPKPNDEQDDAEEKATGKTDLTGI